MIFYMVKDFENIQIWWILKTKIFLFYTIVKSVFFLREFLSPSKDVCFVSLKKYFFHMLIQHSN